MLPALLAIAVETLPQQDLPSRIQPTAELTAQATDTRPTHELPNDSHPYASVKFGAGFPWNYDGEFDLLGRNIDTSLKLDGGFTGELALGYKLNQARAELAVGYGNYPMNRQTFSSSRYGSFSSFSDGAMNLTTVMLNGYYDFPINNKDGSRSRWSPYIGAGIGYANLNVPSCSGEGCFSGGNTGGFAYQGNVGLSYRVSDRGQAFLETGYLGSTSGMIDDVIFGNFSSWRVFLGWRQGFGGSRKATTAAAPAAEAQSDLAPEPTSQPAARGLY